MYLHTFMPHGEYGESRIVIISRQKVPILQSSRQVWRSRHYTGRKRERERGGGGGQGGGWAGRRRGKKDKHL